MTDHRQHRTEKPGQVPAPDHAGATAFEVSLPEDLAAWLQAKITAGVYQDAREAVLLAFQDMRELDQHPEMRRRLFDVTVQALLDEPGSSDSAEQILAELRAQTRDWVQSQSPPHKESR